MEPAFTNQAPGGRGGWWRYVVVFVGAALVLAGGGIGLAAAGAALDRVLPGGIGANLPTLVGWPLTLLAFLLLFRLVHARPVGSLFAAPARRFRAGRALLAYAVGVLVMTAAYAAALQLLRPSADPRTWIGLRSESFTDVVLLIGLVAILLQVTTEELVFRGYLMGGLARTARRPVWPLLVSALLFALVHGPVALLGTGPLGPKLAYLGWTLAMGIAFVLWAWLEGSLAVAIGVHAAVNTFSYFVISPVERAIATPTPEQVELVSNATTAFQLAGLVLISVLLFGRRLRALRFLGAQRPAPLSSSPMEVQPAVTGDRG